MHIAGNFVVLLNFTAFVLLCCCRWVHPACSPLVVRRRTSHSECWESAGPVTCDIWAAALAGLVFVCGVVLLVKGIHFKPAQCAMLCMLEVTVVMAVLRCAFAKRLYSFDQMQWAQCQFIAEATVIACTIVALTGPWHGPFEVFASLRLRDAVLRKAVMLQKALKNHGVKLIIIEADRSSQVFNALHRAKAFIAFGSHDYGELTANLVSSGHEAQYWAATFAQRKKQAEILIRMIRWDQQFPKDTEGGRLFNQNGSAEVWLETAVSDEVPEAVLKHVLNRLAISGVKAHLASCPRYHKAFTHRKCSCGRADVNKQNHLKSIAVKGGKRRQEQLGCRGRKRRARAIAKKRHSQ